MKKQNTTERHHLDILKQRFYGIVIAVTVVALFIGSRCSYKSTLINSFSDFDSIAKTSPPNSNIRFIPWQEMSSMIELCFSYHDDFGIKMSGTATGAVVKYSSRIRWNMDVLKNKLPLRPKYYWLPIYYWTHNNENCKLVAETTLDVIDWHNLLNALFNSGVLDWNEDWSNNVIVGLWDMDSMTDSWGLEIITRNGDTLVSSYGGSLYGHDTLPQNWSVVKGIIDDLRRKTLDKLNQTNAMLESMYEQKFVAQMSDFERSVMLVEYEFKGTLVFKTMSGAIKAAESWDDTLMLELDMSDWLDIIHTLDYGVCESREDFYRNGPGKDKVYVEYSSREDLFMFGRACPEASDNFKKAISAVNAKIRKERDYRR